MNIENMGPEELLYEVKSLRTAFAEATARAQKLTAGRDRLKAAIEKYNKARRKWMSEGDREVHSEVVAWQELEATLTAPEKREVCRWRKINDGRDKNWVGHNGEAFTIAENQAGTVCSI